MGGPVSGARGTLAGAGERAQQRRDRVRAAVEALARRHASARSDKERRELREAISVIASLARSLGIDVT